MSHPVQEWLRPICKVRGSDCVLDGFDCEFYINFDCGEDPDTPAAADTCDIHIIPVGEVPGDGIRVISNADRSQVSRFLRALGLERFPDSSWWRDLSKDCTNETTD